MKKQRHNSCTPNTLMRVSMFWVGYTAATFVVHCANAATPLSSSSSSDFIISGSGTGKEGGGPSLQGIGDTDSIDLPQSDSCKGKCGLSFDQDPSATCFCDAACSFYNGKLALCLLSIKMTLKCVAYYKFSFVCILKNIS